MGAGPWCTGCLAFKFIVLGEKYGCSEATPTITFIGWHAQPVLYGSSLPHFVGTDAIGSEFAERDGLFWAGAWRLGLNSNIPTVAPQQARPLDALAHSFCFAVFFKHFLQALLTMD